MRQTKEEEETILGFYESESEVEGGERDGCSSAQRRHGSSGGGMMQGKAEEAKAASVSREAHASAGERLGGAEAGAGGARRSAGAVRHFAPLGAH